MGKIYMYKWYIQKTDLEGPSKCSKCKKEVGPDYKLYFANSFCPETANETFKVWKAKVSSKNINKKKIKKYKCCIKNALMVTSIIPETACKLLLNFQQNPQYGASDHLFGWCEFNSHLRINCWNLFRELHTLSISIYGSQVTMMLLCWQQSTLKTPTHLS